MLLVRRFILALAGGLCWVAQLGAQQATGTIRGRVTDDATLENWATPLADLKARPSHISAKEYYLLAIDNLHTKSTFPAASRNRVPLFEKDLVPGTLAARRISHKPGTNVRFRPREGESEVGDQIVPYQARSHSLFRDES